MIAFPGMIAEAASQAGIKLPEDIEDFDPKEFPHWQVSASPNFGAPSPTMASIGITPRLSPLSPTIRF